MATSMLYALPILTSSKHIIFRYVLVELRSRGFQR